MRHIVRDTAHTITHETGMPQHDVRSREITNEVIATLNASLTDEAR